MKNALRHGRIGWTVLLMLVLGGCAATGAQLDVSNQLRLQDLYFASTGIYVHQGIGAYVATLCATLGAFDTKINTTVPYSRRRADLMCEFADRREIYEIKPKSWARRSDDATEQIMTYVTGYNRLNDGIVTMPGRRVSIEPTPMTVPDEFVPILAANGIKIEIRTWPLVPGLITYTYKWKDNKKKLTEAGLASVIYEITSSDLKWKYDKAKAELITLVAQEHYDTGSSSLEESLLEIEEDSDAAAPGETDRPRRLFGGALRHELMQMIVPDWYYTTPRVPIPIPGQNNQGKSWDCDQRRCG